MMHRKDQVNGTTAAVFAFLLWGILPFYWKALQSIDALEIVAHRIVWTFVLTLPLVALRNRFSLYKKPFARVSLLAPYILSSALILVNWLIYVWAVNNEHIIEASLGYFLNPLFNVFLGFVFLQERLRKLQWLAVLLAVVGVCILIVDAGVFPWVAIGLALTFGLYGLLRKKSAQGSMTGLAIEMTLASPFAMVFLFVYLAHGQADLGQVPFKTHLLLAGTGIVTALPLLLFAYGAQRIQLATIGIVQYLAPSLQFLIGLSVYGEHFDATQFTTFCFIWGALVLYSWDSLRTYLRHRH